MNRVENPNASELLILRDLSSKTIKANAAVSNSIFFFRSSVRLSQEPPKVYVHMVDSSLANVVANFGKSFPRPDLVKSFREYADNWYKETIRDSSTSRMTSNVNYLKVIKLGPAVVPLILRELQSDPAPWFLALRVLTENTEVGKGHAGDFEKIAEAWISWGKERGLI
jgi:hypothetical protein